ncbi:kinase-like protein, partial [Ophiobolus disseminans]
YVGIIMSPVADCNLEDFLDRDPTSAGDCSFLRIFYGCLAAALRYLHQNCIRHNDIKPQARRCSLSNVLVKANHVYLTDFGVCPDWSELSGSTTEGPSSKTRRYCAPEVAESHLRSFLANIWSLGCVFLEIWTATCYHSVDELLMYMTEQGAGVSCYYANTEAVA